jgi:hypothetical protein
MLEWLTTLIVCSHEETLYWIYILENEHNIRNENKNIDESDIPYNIPTTPVQDAYTSSNPIFSEDFSSRFFQ